MFDNNPFSGFLNAWAQASAAALQFSANRLTDLANFLGLADKPDTVLESAPYIPPFTGGQCEVNYAISVRATRANGTFDFGGGVLRGKITGITTRRLNAGQFSVGVGNDKGEFLPIFTLDDANPNALTGFIFNALEPTSGVDNCGDLPNPNPPLPVDIGAFGSLNPDGGGDGELVYAGLPVLTVGGILAALRAIADAISVIGDVLDGINQIGEALKKLTDLLKELFDGKKDDDKAKPKYRRYSVGEWFDLRGIDGLISTTPITLGGVEAIPYKVQIVVKEFPPSSSRILGVKSPSISIDTLPLFYLLLQEDDYGVTAVKPIRTLNSSTSIPPFHRGIFWNFRLNPSINAKYRLFYQTEQIEEEVEVQE